MNGTTTRTSKSARVPLLVVLAVVAVLLGVWTISDSQIIMGVIWLAVGALALLTAVRRHRNVT